MLRHPLIAPLVRLTIAVAVAVALGCGRGAQAQKKSLDSSPRTEKAKEDCLRAAMAGRSAGRPAILKLKADLAAKGLDFSDTIIDLRRSEERFCSLVATCLSPDPFQRSMIFDSCLKDQMRDDLGIE